MSRTSRLASGSREPGDGAADAGGQLAVHQPLERARPAGQQLAAQGDRGVVWQVELPADGPLAGPDVEPVQPDEMLEGRLADPQGERQRAAVREVADPAAGLHQGLLDDVRRVHAGPQPGVHADFDDPAHERADAGD